MNYLLRLVAVLLIAMTLAGCDRRHDDTPTPAPAPDRSDATAAVTTPAGAPTTPDVAHAPDYAPMPVLALSAQGLELVDPTTGSIRRLHFDSGIDLVIDALTQVRGVAPALSDNPECGAGPVQFASWDDGLSLLAQNGIFAGWSLHQGGMPTDTTLTPATANGVGLGTLRSELEAAYEVEIFDSSLGSEFVTGELQGLLESEQADARITALWAGLSCVFR